MLSRPAFHLWSRCIALACLAGPAGGGQPDWPQWRGPAGDGHAPAAHDLPVTWSETEHVAWKTPLPGRGWSSPVLGTGQLWVTTAIEREASAEEQARRLAGNRMAGQLAVSGPVTVRAVCLDQATGRILHDVELFTVADPQPIHKLNSYASPSPVLAAGRLYCHCGDFGAACIDTATGKLLWTNRELRLNHENGPGSTPVVWQDKLIVHLDGSDVQSIAAYDTATGQIAWQTPRSGVLREDPQLKKAYGTPVILPLGGREVLVSPAADWLYGYDPATGGELWKMSYGGLGFSIVPRPVTCGDLLFMSTSFMQPELLAVKLAGPDRPPEIAWREKKGAPTMSSPLVVGDLVYMVSDKGVGTCLDVKTGAPAWSQRLGGNFSSSPLFADGRIYAGNRDGDTFVIKPGREYELLATNHLDGGIYATPAAVGRAIYLRTEKAVYRLEKPAASAATASPSAARDGALPRFNRSFEYDSLGGDYATFLLDELLPAVETKATADGRKLVLSKRGADRSIGGNSSGAICAFTAAWERPDAFSRVFSGIGTYVGLRGGHVYSTLVRKVEPKPIRVFLEDGSADLDIDGEDWRLVGAGYKFTEGPAANARGELFFNDVGNSKTYRVTPEWTAEVWLEDSRRGDGQNFAPDGTDTVVDTGLRFSNGLCLSPDQTLLYVADSRSHWVWSWQVRPDGTLAHKQRYYHLHVPDTADDSGADGMRVDRDGRLYVATRMGIQVCDQAGRVNCIIPTPNGRISNLCFGGPDFDMLLATCGDKVYVRKLTAQGAANFLPPVTPAKPRL